MLGNISPWQLLIIFLIVLLIFGTKKLRNMGGDLGSAIRDFRKGMSSEEEQEEQDAKEKGRDRDTDEKPTSAKASEVDAKKSNNHSNS